MAENKQFEIRLDQDRMVEKMDVDGFIAILDVLAAFYEFTRSGIQDFAKIAELASSIKYLRGIVCEFVYVDGDYLAAEEADPIVGKMSLANLIKTVQILTQGAEAVAVPEE